MTITREKLELAAKAAGIEVAFERQDEYPLTRSTGDWWWPDVDRGQLLDLAMACGIDICATEGFIGYYRTKFDYVSVNVNCQDFPALAEAVILAAAEQQLAKEGE